MSTALLVIDVQTALIDRFPFGEGYVERVTKAISTARQEGLPIIFTGLAFRPAHTSFPARWRNTVLDDLRSELVEGTPGAAAHPALGLRPTDSHIMRRRPPAFYGTDLDILLRTQGISHLVLVGNATSRGVLIAQTEAYARDLETTLLSDCCADLDPEAHNFALTRLCPGYGRVVTHDEWAESLQAKGPTG